jgi:chorismate synthase
MSSIWGNKLKISIFGESHGEAIGVTIDGLPSGIELDLNAIEDFMQRRCANGLPWATKRKEADKPRIISGFYKGRTTGTPLCAIIENSDTRSEDYNSLTVTPRPGHADLTATARYGGHQDPRGGGHFSGRLTAPLVFAGAVCRQILEIKKVYIFGHISSIKDLEDYRFDSLTRDFKSLRDLAANPFPVLNQDIRQSMIDEIEKCRMDLDSCGGTVECMAAGMPAGTGDPIFGGMESRIASIMFSIPAVKGVEFGLGFASTKINGSQNNDTPRISDNGNSIYYTSNNAGGIEGGICNGMPIVCRVAFKPTPSIAKEQDTIDLDEMKNVRFSVKGRHDPCVVPRAVPVVEAAMAIALLDSYVESQGISAIL